MTETPADVLRKLYEHIEATRKKQEPVPEKAKDTPTQPIQKEEVLPDKMCKYADAGIFSDDNDSKNLVAEILSATNAMILGLPNIKEEVLLLLAWEIVQYARKAQQEARLAVEPVLVAEPVHPVGTEAPTCGQTEPNKIKLCGSLSFE